MQRFPSLRQQQAKGSVDSDHAPPTSRTDQIKPVAVDKLKPNWNAPNGRAEVTNQNVSTADRPITMAGGDASPLVRRAMVPSHVAPIESDWSSSPPMKKADLPTHTPQTVHTTLDHHKQPPTTTNSFQKFLIKKTAQAPGGGGALDHARSLQDSVDSSPKSTPVMDIGYSGPKQSGLPPKELPPSILNRIAKNVVRGKPNRQQYGNIASSGDLIANLAMKYGKQPMGGAVRVQDPMPVKQQPVKPVAATPDHVITDECKNSHCAC